MRRARKQETPKEGALTPAAAQELGRVLGQIRRVQNKTYREVSKDGGIAYQYVNDIEGGYRPTVTDEFYRKLQHGLGMPESMMDDLLFRARVMSALERRGLTPDQQMFVWRGIEQRLVEQGVEVVTDPGVLIAAFVS